MIIVDGKKGTPKQKAQDLVSEQLEKLLEGYWIEREEAAKEFGPGLTEREIEQVTDQLEKLTDRIGRKYLGWA